MSIRELIKNREPILIDGSIGALLIAKDIVGAKMHRINIENPEILTDIHRAYLDVGCDVILTNTFNITSETLNKTNMTIQEIVTGAVRAAEKAFIGKSGKFLALDLGPSGKMLEPIGDSSFKDAYEHYKAQIEPVKNDIDLIVIETVSDLKEMESAITAINDICDVPIFAAMTFTEKMKTWIGVSLEEWATLVNTAPIDVAGINCTLTPKQMLPLIMNFKKMVNLPVFAEPNRGQPEKVGNKTIYRMSAEEFADDVMDIYDSGVKIIGGCCGSDPECMRIIREEIDKRK